MRRWLALLAMTLLTTPAAAQSSVTAAQDLLTTTCPGQGCVALQLVDAGSVAVQVSGTFSGTVTFESSIDGVTYTALLLTPTPSATPASTTTTTGLWRGASGGLGFVRARFSSYSSGRAGTTIQSGTSGDVVGPSTVTDGHLAVFDGTTGKLIKDGGAVPSGGGSITCLDTGVLFADGANNPACNAGLTYNKTTHTLTTAGSGASDPFLRVNNTVATKGLAVFVNDSGGVQFVADDNDFTTFFVMNPAADITFSPATVLAITNQIGGAIWTFNPNSGPIVDAAADLRFGNGFGIKADTTTAHTVLFRAYDVDGAAYATFATLTNGNTPDFTIAPPAGGTVTLQASTFKSAAGSVGVSGATCSNYENGLCVAN